MNNRIKILIACHKPDVIYHDDIYTPIHVGRSISKFKDEMAWMIGDDTGENISIKNPYYSELTAQYWGWKNLDVDFFGLCHYRRFFKNKITDDNVDSFLGDKYDVVLSAPLYEKMMLGNRLIMSTCLEDTYIFTQCIKKIQPEYFNTTMAFLAGIKMIPYNMFIMRKELFDKFAAWQFSILFEVEKHIRYSEYSRMKRVLGYMGEMLLPIYSIRNNLRINYMPVVDSLSEEGMLLNNTKVGPIKRNLLHFFYGNDSFSFGDERAIEVGLKNDGIVI